MKKTPPTAKFPVDVQSDPFFAALSSALLPALGYTEKTPFWCASKEDYCDDCDACGNKSMLERQELMLYHSLLSATGVAFCFDYPEDDEVGFHTLPNTELGWRWKSDFIDYIMRLIGLSWKRYTLGAERAEVYAAVEGSIEAGYPVMMRLGGDCFFGSDCAWQVITACDGGTLYGYEYGGEFSSQNWYDTFTDAIIITGRKKPEITYHDVLDKIASVLSHPAYSEFERFIYDYIDGATQENADERALAIGAITGVPIEARWHSAEAFRSSHSLINRLYGSDDALRLRMKKLLCDRYADANCDATYGVCCRIWGIVGFGHVPGYVGSSCNGARLLANGAKAELKRLFGLVFENDRAVLNGINAELQAISGQ